MYVSHVRGGKRLKVRKGSLFERKRERYRNGAEKKRGKEDSSMLLQREKREEAGSCSVFEWREQKTGPKINLKSEKEGVRERERKRA